jgi:hypothetical protein
VKGTADCAIPAPLNLYTDGFLVRHVEISVAQPDGVKMFDKLYPGGIAASYDYTMFGLDVAATLRVQEKIIEVFGHISPINTKYFKLTAFLD